MRIRFVAGLLIVLLAVSASWAGDPLVTEFTYQGQLKDAGSPANGPHGSAIRMVSPELPELWSQKK